jgi:integrase
VTKAFPKLAAAAGVRPVRFHDLRHGYAMLALKAGAHPKAVQERLGHSSITVTMDIYGSVMRSVAKEAARVVSAELARAASEA